MKPNVVAAIFAALLSMSCGLFGGNSLVGKICFESDSDIWVVGADGQGLTNLTNTPDMSEGSCRWSADGTKMVFADVIERHLYIMNADGSGRQPVAEGFESAHASWSPDGRQLLFIASTLIGQSFVNDLNLLDLETGYIENLINDSETAITDAAFSPDGKQIAVGLGGNIYVMSASGEDQRKVSQQSDDFMLFNNAQWSPDGKRILYHGVPGATREHPYAPIALYVVNADGSGLKTLTDNDRGNYCGSWSPDGRKIAFISDREGEQYNLRLFIMNADGSEAQMVIDQYANCSNWQPSVP